MSASFANGVGEASSENGAGPSAAAVSGQGTGSSAGRRPEVAVGAAFVGGLLLAFLLRRARA